MKTKLTNKVIPAGIIGQHPHAILTGKPVENSNVTVYLLSALTGDQERHYSLWNIEIINDGDLRMTPYKGGEYECFMLELELGDDFVKHAFDD
jgi:hypothetical protein